MTNYVGIDLGTTNSVISSYDGETLKTYKSPEQHSVTPSAIYIDKRSRYYGARAYQMTALAPNNTAALFKRLMGTSTPIKIPAVGLELTPEECSAEILRVLFGYLPEDIRNDTQTGTVITVPAAFNQMQKDSTLSAAEIAGIGKVALMQEPVAAVMAVMRTRKSDGMFLVYDLGGGTLDVALAESTAGRVSLLEHGGIAMCGGSDFDRAMVDNVVKPWLRENFKLPDDFSTGTKYQQLIRLARLASEQAKIVLSAKEEATISWPDAEVRTKDEAGSDIYLDIPISRKQLDSLMESKIAESLQATREVLEKAHVSSHDIERIVFVGGPTQYKPLRERIASELGIPGATDVDPMTAVAEGAALFAESIDWSTADRKRKNVRGTLSAGGRLQLAFSYQARTPDVKSKLVIQAKGQIQAGSTFQIDSLDSGWSSGRVALKDGASVVMTLAKNGENRFKVFVFDSKGGPFSLPQDIITITRTTATIDAIPASHSIAMAAKDKMGGKVILDYLVKAGDPLPKKGQKKFRTEESLRAGGPGAIMLNLWQGDIEQPYTDNQPVGTFKITGSDFDEGVIHAGAELICDYEIMDSGNITMTVTVPSVGGTFSPAHNFYSRQEGLIDYTTAGKQVTVESNAVLERLDEISAKVDDEKLEQARQKLAEVESLCSQSSDPESCKQGTENVLEAKRLLSRVRKDHLKAIRAIELERPVKFFNENIRTLAKPSEATSFDNLVRAAQRSIEINGNDFEGLLDQLRSLNWQILWRQDWFIVESFKRHAGEDYMYTDKARFQELVKIGQQALKTDNIDQLRQIVATLATIRVSSGGSDDTMDIVNILRG